MKAVWRLLRASARRLGAQGELHGGGVCFWQWFGSSLQVTPHLHLLVPEALWTEAGVVVPLPPPDDQEVAEVLARVLRQARTDWADLEAAWPEDDSEGLQVAALQKPLALALADSTQRRRRVAVLEGFSLHPDTAVHGNDREGLARLCRSGARGPLSLSRLTRLPEGKCRYTLKKGVAFTLTAVALEMVVLNAITSLRRRVTSARLHTARR